MLQTRWDEIDPEALANMPLHPVDRAKWYLLTLQPDERKKPAGAIMVQLLDYVAELTASHCQRGAKMQILREQFREVDWHHACLDRPEMREWFDNDGVPK